MITVSRKLWRKQKRKWNEKEIICDAVRAIRTFRPLVVISRFSGTPKDGHGQHQFAGYIAPLAVKAAADANQCKDTGTPWQVQKFYVSQGFRSNRRTDFARSIRDNMIFCLVAVTTEIAAEGRSQHKTQEQGGLELKGDRYSGLNLIESVNPKVEKETSVFDGIDTSLAGIAKTFGKEGKVIDEQTKQNLAIIQNSAEQVLKEFDSTDPQRLLPILVRGFEAAYNIGGGLHNYSDFSTIAAEKYFEFNEAIKLAAGIQIEALADKETVVPGEDFSVNVKVFFPNPEGVKVKVIYLNAPKDWQIEKTQPSKTETQPSFRQEIANEAAVFKVKIPSNEKLTQPYWLERERDRCLYQWEKVFLFNQTLAFALPLVTATVAVNIDGHEIYLKSHPVEYRYADDIRGEIRRELSVVPAISVSLDQNILIVQQSNKAQKKRLVMSLTNNSQSPMRGIVSLNFNSSKELKYFGEFSDF